MWLLVTWRAIYSISNRQDSRILHLEIGTRLARPSGNLLHSSWPWICGTKTDFERGKLHSLDIHIFFQYDRLYLWTLCIAVISLEQREMTCKHITMSWLVFNMGRTYVPIWMLLHVTWCYKDYPCTRDIIFNAKYMFQSLIPLSKWQLTRKGANTVYYLYISFESLTWNEMNCNVREILIVSQFQGIISVLSADLIRRWGDDVHEDSTAAGGVFIFSKQWEIGIV